MLLVDVSGSMAPPLSWLLHVPDAPYLQMHCALAHTRLAASTTTTLSITLAFLLLTFLHIALSELVPRFVAIRHPELATTLTSMMSSTGSPDVGEDRKSTRLNSSH
mgnify:CR=1 FL=1